MFFLSSSNSHDNRLIIEEIEKIFTISSRKIDEIINIHKEITIENYVKVHSISEISQSDSNFIDYILCYTVKISLKIEYIENNSLLLLPIIFFYSSYITFKNKFETIHLNPKINRLLIEKLEEENLYIYINFFPY